MGAAVFVAETIIETTLDNNDVDCSGCGDVDCSGCGDVDCGCFD